MVAQQVKPIERSLPMNTSQILPQGSSLAAPALERDSQGLSLD